MDENIPRERILDAAEQAFLDSGLAGARVASIAQAAGVNKAMLYYYFGPKDELYKAVFVRVLEQVVAAVGRTLEGDEAITAPERLGRFFDAYASVFQQHPGFVRLVVREILDGGTLFAELAVPRFGALIPRVLQVAAEAQAQGQLPAGMDPRILPPLVISPVIFMAFAGPTLGEILGVDPEPYAAQFNATARNLLVAGLTALAAETP